MLEEKYKGENIMTTPHSTNLENNVLWYQVRILLWFIMFTLSTKTTTYKLNVPSFIKMVCSQVMISFIQFHIPLCYSKC